MQIACFLKISKNLFQLSGNCYGCQHIYVYMKGIFYEVIQIIYLDKKFLWKIIKLLRDEFEIFTEKFNKKK